MPDSSWQQAVLRDLGVAQRGLQVLEAASSVAVQPAWGAEAPPRPVPEPEPEPAVAPVVMPEQVQAAPQPPPPPVQPTVEPPVSSQVEPSQGVVEAPPPV